MGKSWNLTNRFCILTNQRRYATAFQSQNNMYVDLQVMEFCNLVMKKSWNFVAKISW